MTMYHANAERGDRFWVIYVPEVDRWTQARRVHDIEPTARDLIAVMDEVDPGSIELTVKITLPRSAVKHLDARNKLRQQAADANTAAADELRAAVRALTHGEGLSQREVAEVLDVSPQRVSQLANC